jgi:peptidoglycan hydrolase CwlO-like protein
MRRPGRPRVDVERSTGVAEHHRRTVLTRTYRHRFVAVACAAALAFGPAHAAHATSPSDQIASTKNAIESAAERWFAAQNEAASIDASIADVQTRINEAQATIDRTRKVATARAVMIYKSSDVGITSIIGDTALDSARRAHLVDDANASGDEAIAELTIAVDNLNVERKNLEVQRAHQQKVLSDVQAERTELDSELAKLRAEARSQARIALTAARSQAARARADARVRELSAPTPSAPTSVSAAIAPPTAPPTPAPTQVVVTPPTDSGRVSPHHNDPFLVCTRARESGGNYGAVSPSGYYGAYQFLPSTWDVTVVHEGRSDLVGVLPSRASEYDQDEAAWTLYQWQGNGPWGGRC